MRRVDSRIVRMVIVLACIFAALSIARWSPAKGRDLDGRYSQSPLKSWFDELYSQNGLCCSFADGFSIDDPDVDSRNNHYRVRIKGVWIEVPDYALVKVPNKYGRAVVWPIDDESGNMTIRCFMPGAGI